MKKKLILMVTLLSLCVAALFGQQETLVVAAFENRGAKLDAAGLSNLQDYLINAFINTGQFRVPDRNSKDLLSAEQKFQLDDWSDNKKSAEMGKMLNADYIVRVTAMYDGKSNVLSARILDVNTAHGLGAAEMEFMDQSEARKNMEEFVGKILQRIGRSGGVQPVSGGRTSRGAPANMVLVEGGSFQMGSNNGSGDEKPVHNVTVKSFYMGKYEVTQKEWREIMGGNPSNFKGDDLPVENISWYEAVEYCNKLSQKEGLTPAYRGSGDGISCDWNANGYRLPTEAEWEYAAKGGNRELMAYEYAGSNSIDTVAWYDGNSGSKTHPVGGKMPNALGLYDMSGNVWEWCWDWYSSSSYSGGAQTDPRGASSGSFRVSRGGSWSDSAAYVRSAYRFYNSPSYRFNVLGFRLVRP